MGYSLGLLPGHHDPTTQSYPIAALIPLRELQLGEAVGPTPCSNRWEFILPLGGSTIRKSFLPVTSAMSAISSDVCV
jgi:hypothetical protein